jgi:expansin (peptidoglycan-binding protein)
MKSLVFVLLAACGGGVGAEVDGGGGGGGGGVDAAIGSACLAAPAEEMGQATYYDADGTGNCSFDAGSDFLIAAMNATDYGDAVWCGACVDVTGPTGHVVVRIVDKCPGCSRGSLDLSETAFGMISPLSAGRVDISWHEVECPVTGPVSYDFQSGSSKFYTAIQLRNTRYPIATLESLDGSGVATALMRADYNYFIGANGIGPGPYTLRVTDQRGQVLDDTGIALDPGGESAGAAQFPVCP